MKKESDISRKDKNGNPLDVCNLTEEERTEIAGSLTGVADLKCGVCGIKGNFGANVCDPVQLPEIHWFGD